jgi:hypothetical protein
MAFVEDTTAFFDVALGFAVQATVTTRHGEVVSFAVIFDNGYSAQLGAGLMEASQPQAVARSVDVVDLAHRCAITIAGADYRVVEIQPDGTGMTTLLLERAA